MYNSSVKSILTALVCGILMFSGAAHATSITPPSDKPLTRTEVEEIVKQVIREQPTLILESVTDFQRKKQLEAASNASKNIASLQGQLLNDTNSPSIGNPNADVTVVEFFDYHCGYCKKFLPTVSKLLSDDTNLRFVFKEFPILSEDSTMAAKAALAVHKIDKNKYMTYHTALMKMNTGYTIENLTEKAKEIGINPDTFKKEIAHPSIEAELKKNKELAYALEIHGTPAMVIGTNIVPGAVSVNELKAKIEQARAAKKK